MTRYKYILEPYGGMKTRYHCPNCQHKQKTFSRYIDTETRQYLHPNVGRCNREINCGYHYTPRQYFQDNETSFDKPLLKRANTPQIARQIKPTTFIRPDVFKGSLRKYNANHFVAYLITLFGTEIASELICRYFIGTSKHWSGATAFWQIDSQGNVRTGKMMLYNPTTGKRVKEPFDHINWVHTAIKPFELKQCFFGEHLLIDKSKPVAIVESEKTAIIASVYFPQFVWLATGGSENLSVEKCHVLQGRTVVLFPDLKCFEKWSKKASDLSRIAIIQVSELLEHKATDHERTQGLDLADYLVRFNFLEFSARNKSNL